jgi:hypothetical protein
MSSTEEDDMAEDPFAAHTYHFDFDPEVHAELINRLLQSPELALMKDVGPNLKGVYALFRHHKMVYAGKALSTTLKRRLAEHRIKISKRLNIKPEEMTCRFLIIDVDWLVWAAEDTLIKSLGPPWNASGFGRHPQGGNRQDGANRWDTEFPIA